MKTALLFCLVFFIKHSICKAQIPSSIESVKTSKQAKKYIAAHPGEDVSLITLFEGRDTALQLLPLYHAGKGTVIRVNDYQYQALDIAKARYFHVLYIFFDGNIKGYLSIDSTRKKIINDYKSGTSFRELHAKYNMETYSSLDMGWFPEDQMVKDFETAVKTHQVNEIFSVDCPAQEWYYVVLKLGDKNLRTMTLLKWPTK